jgi:hypothetical protein
MARASTVSRDEVVAWLLTGDSAVRHQTVRDLHLDGPRVDETSIATDGDAAVLLSARNPDGHWGRGFYQPKWTSSHYTLLELRQLELSGTHPAAQATVGLILEQKASDGGVNPSGSVRVSDVCVNGMFLDYASWFGAPEPGLVSVVDFLLGVRMPDGGFNCRSNRSGASTASVHTTLSVLEGLTTYLHRGGRHRESEVLAARDDAVECLLARELFRVRGTQDAIRPELTRLHHPTRWHFDVLRALDALRVAGVAHDRRMEAALDVVVGRRRPDGRWAAASGYPGQTHVAYPRAGEPNRWVTLRALRVLDAYRPTAAGL